MAPLTSSTRSSGADQQRTGSTGGGRSSGGRLRTLLVAAGLLAIGYVVTRRARSGDIRQSTGGLREKANQALPGDGRTIPIGDPGESGADESGSEGSGSDESGPTKSGSRESGTGESGSGRSGTDESGGATGEEDGQGTDRETEDREGRDGGSRA